MGSGGSCCFDLRAVIKIDAIGSPRAFAPCQAGDKVDSAIIEVGSTLSSVDVEVEPSDSNGFGYRNRTNRRININHSTATF